MAETLGGPGRARAVLGALRRGLDPWAPGTLAEGARARLEAACKKTPAEIASIHDSEDGTLKAMVSFRGDRRVEMVLIPHLPAVDLETRRARSARSAREPEANRSARTTLCISSQVGCARGCRFCLTATMGLLSNLESDEIVAQVALAIALQRTRSMPPIKNLVLMGMGEPLDNLPAVRAALAVIAGEGGLGIGPRHITVSTVAPSPQAVRRAVDLPAHLAWSLHAAEDELRRSLVPTARHDVVALRDAFAEVLGGKAPLFVEVTLIDGLNDQPSHAEAIARLFAEFPSEVRINLLPMNPIGSTWRPTPPDRVLEFRDRLIALGLRTMVRRARGTDRRAACGQLVIEGS